MSTLNISPIPGGSVEMGVITFDILTHNTQGQLAVFCRSGDAINNFHREQLIDKTRTFFVRSSAQNSFLDYLFERIERVVTGKFIKSQDKAELMFRIGNRIVQRIYAAPKNNLNVQQFGRFTKSYIDLMLYSKEAADRLLELSSESPYSVSHAINVSTLCMLIGQKIFGHNRKKLWDLGLGGVLIDIGMTSIDPVILNKKNDLTTAEFNIVRKHPLYSRDIMEGHHLDSPLVAMGLHHHERFDGTGYPFALQGENIPMFARIAAVADVYDAVTSNRTYKQQSDSFSALAEMYKERELYDQTVLEALMRVVLKSVKLVNAFIAKHAPERARASVQPTISAHLEEEDIPEAEDGWSIIIDSHEE